MTTDLLRLPGPWASQAACRDHPDPDLWHPPAARHPDTRRAVAICQDCPVRTECASHALAVGERWGIWGGLTQRDRSRRARTHKTCRRCARALPVEDYIVNETHTDGLSSHCRDCVAAARRDYVRRQAPPTPEQVAARRRAAQVRKEAARRELAALGWSPAKIRAALDGMGGQR